MCRSAAREAREQVVERIAEIGSSAMLAFEAARHVGQLQFRPYLSGTTSPDGINDPLYWMDFEARHRRCRSEPWPSSASTWVSSRDGSARDSQYFGRRMGTDLLDATSCGRGKPGFEAVVAKATPPTWPIPQFMGGMPPGVYASRGFEQAVSYHDAALRRGLDGVLEGRYGSQWQEGLARLVQEGADLDSWPRPPSAC